MEGTLGAWSAAIVDSGVTDETEAAYGANAYEFDYYNWNSDTDGGRSTSHGSLVAAAVELTNSSLERLDLQITNNAATVLSSSAISSALNTVGNLSDQGWNVGAVNMSFGSDYYSWTSRFRSQIALLNNDGIYTVAAAGNGGSDTRIETPIYPAGLDYVISVGSHDGSGNPSWFSQNSDTGVHILADGENFPGNDDYGTSYAAPQVTATVTTMQALVEGATGDRLSFAEVIDALQQGGAGPRSTVDPADNATTYYLHDHAGSVNYVLQTYVDPAFSGLEYIASYSDIEAAFGRDATGARSHFIETGAWDGRMSSFDGLEYIASYSDLRAAFGGDRAAGASHFLDAGRAEGRATTFDAEAYMAANPDVAAAVGGDPDQATLHYINNGAAEGRATNGATPAVNEQPAISEGSSDLARGPWSEGCVGVGQTVTGTIGYDGDRDWFATELTAGETIVIQVRGAASGGGTLYDPELYVYDSEGDFLTYDFDNGTGWDAYLALTVTTNGTYYLEVDGYSHYTGSYTLDVTSASVSSLSDLAAGADTADRHASTFGDVEVALLSDGQLSSDPFGLL
ncbi:MAG: S8 family serine peptidase [Thalassobaculaceae bacterium]|nr:S8 family serine peptidase [Thalassobaculaceae bacterium]